MLSWYHFLLASLSFLTTTLVGWLCLLGLTYHHKEGLQILPFIFSHYISAQFSLNFLWHLSILWESRAVKSSHRIQNSPFLSMISLNTAKGKMESTQESTLITSEQEKFLDKYQQGQMPGHRPWVSMQQRTSIQYWAIRKKHEIFRIISHPTNIYNVLTHYKWTKVPRYNQYNDSERQSENSDNSNSWIV